MVTLVWMLRSGSLHRIVFDKIYLAIFEGPVEFNTTLTLVKSVSCSVGRINVTAGYERSAISGDINNLSPFKLQDFFGLPKFYFCLKEKYFIFSTLFIFRVRSDVSKMGRPILF